MSDPLRDLWATTFSPELLDGAPSGASFRPEGTLPPPEDMLAPTLTLPEGGTAAHGYEALDELGRGGMGVVVRARQRCLQREVALKRLRAERMTPEAEAAFVSEALVTGSLDHPNIVPVHELIAEPGEVSLAMKLVGGRSWKDLLHPKDPDAEVAPLGEQLAILRQVCNAVAFAHSRGVVHRDLKPENVMVGDFGEVLVMDWGLAVDVRAPGASPGFAPLASDVSQPAGTPAYMAPELANGDGAAIGVWTDVYLLGAILHELLTGSPPHRAKTVMAAVLAAAVSAPPEFGPDVPAELGAVCKRAMRAAPEERYPDVSSFQRALEAFLEHRESASIAEAAEAELERANAHASAARETGYAGFAEALAGFRQAQILWKGNEHAREGEERARLAYARAALEAGDLRLAESLVEALGSDERAQEVSAQSERRRREQAEAARAARRTRRVATALVGLVVGTLAVATAVVNQQRGEAERRRGEAEQARGVAEEAKDVADRRRREAEREALRAQVLSAEARLDSLVVRGEEIPHREEIEAAADLCAAVDAVETTGGGGAEEASLVERLGRVRRAAENLAQRSAGAWATGAGSVGGLGPGEPVAAVAYTPDGGRTIVARTSRIVVRSSSGGAVEHELIGHGGAIKALACGPDGASLLSAAADGSLILWDLDSGRARWERAVSSSPLTACGFSADGAEAFVAAEAGRVVAVDVASGARERVVFEDVSAAACVVRVAGGKLWSSDAVSSAGVRVHELATGASLPGVVVEPELFALNVVASRNGERAVLYGFQFEVGSVFSTSLEDVTRDHEVELWDTAAGRRLMRVDAPGAGLTAAAVSDEGVVAVGTADGGLVVWGPDGRERLARATGDGSSVTALSFSPDSAELLVARRWRVEVLETRGWTRIRSPAGSGAVASAAAASPDGEVLVVGARDGTLRVWERETGRVRHLLVGHQGAVRDCAVSVDGREAISVAVDGSLRQWDLVAGTCSRVEEAHAEGARACAFGPAGVVTAGVDGGLAAWAWTPGPATKRAQAGARVACLDLDASGRLAVVGRSDGRVARWDPVSGGEVELLGALHPMPVTACAVSPDGEWVVSGCGRGVVVRQHLPSGRSTFDAAGGPVAAVAVGNDGHALVATVGRTPAVLEWGGETKPRFVTQSRPVAVGLLGDQQLFWAETSGALRFADLERRALRITRPYGKLLLPLEPGRVLTLAAGGRVLDVDSGRYLQAFGPSTAIDVAVNAGAASSDGATVALGYTDGRIAVVDRRGEPKITRELRAAARVDCLAFTAAGGVLAGSKGRLEHWDAAGRKQGEWAAGTRSFESCWEAEPGLVVALPKEARWVFTVEPESGTVTRCASGSSNIVAAIPDRDSVLLLRAGRVEEWDRRLSALRRELPIRIKGWTLASSPDGRWLAVGDMEGGVHLLDRPLGHVLRSWSLSEHAIDPIAFSSDGRHLLAGSTETFGDELRRLTLDPAFEDQFVGFADDPRRSAWRVRANLTRSGRAWDAPRHGPSPFVSWPAPATPFAPASDPAAWEDRGRALLLSGGGASAHPWLEAAAAAGRPCAVARLAWALERGLGAPADLARARRLREQVEGQASLADSPLAQVRRAVEVGDVAALRRAAERGEPDALLTLAERFEAEAPALLRRAVALGDPSAFCALADRELSAGRVPSGLDLLERAAAANHRKALGRLTKIYRQGRLVPADEAKADAYGKRYYAAGD